MALRLPRSTASKVMDLGQKVVTSFLVLGSGYLAVQLGVGYYKSHTYPTPH